jgi:hypothetical protein
VDLKARTYDISHEPVLGGGHELLRAGPCEGGSR